MRFQRLRRAILAAACLSSLLAACGGGESVVSKFIPTRVVAFGDAFSDVGQRGSQYTVNDASRINWTQQLAARYGLGLGPVSGGGTSYATGSARVTAKPDAAGDASTPSISEQVGVFLATSRPEDKDIVVVSGGVSDILAEVAAFQAGTQDAATTTSHVKQAGRDLCEQVKRLVGAGATHVLVAGAYNLGRSPWAVINGQGPFAESLAGVFNNALLVSIVDLGSSVLYIDTALFYNLVTANPLSYSITNVTSIACASTDAGPGIGIGAGQVNSALCTGSTLTPGVDPATTLFADPVYFTPVGQALFGNYAADRLRARF